MSNKIEKFNEFYSEPSMRMQEKEKTPANFCVAALEQFEKEIDIDKIYNFISEELKSKGIDPEKVAY